MDKIRVGVIGLGQRGDGLAFRFLPKMDNVQVTAVCDIYEDRVKGTACRPHRRAGLSQTL